MQAQASSDCAALLSPFSQRVWIALEAKGMSYQYCEVDPGKAATRTPSAPLVGADPGSCVPAMRQGEWACRKSSVLLEYVSLVPPAPFAAAPSAEVSWLRFARC